MPMLSFANNCLFTYRSSCYFAIAVCAFCWSYVQASELRSIVEGRAHKVLQDFDSLGMYFRSIPLASLPTGTAGELPLNLEFSSCPNYVGVLGVGWGINVLDSTVIQTDSYSYLFTAIGGERVSFNLSRPLVNGVDGCAVTAGSWSFEIGKKEGDYRVTRSGGITQTYVFRDHELVEWSGKWGTDKAFKLLYRRTASGRVSVYDLLSRCTLFEFRQVRGRSDAYELYIPSRRESVLFHSKSSEALGVDQKLLSQVLNEGNSMTYTISYSDYDFPDQLKMQYKSACNRFGLKTRLREGLIHMEIVECESGVELSRGSVTWDAKSGYTAAKDSELYYSWGASCSAAAESRQEFNILRPDSSGRGLAYENLDMKSARHVYANDTGYYIEKKMILTPGVNYLKPRSIFARMPGGSSLRQFYSYERNGNSKKPRLIENE